MESEWIDPKSIWPIVRDQRFDLAFWVFKSKEQEAGSRGFMPSGSAVKGEQIEIIYPTGVRL
ncbi:hypothetical protein ACLVWM_16810, partial [Leadbetterella byssophila]